jgi:hypothetical protein
MGDFRKACRERVVTTFTTLGLAAPGFREVEGGRYLVAEFEHRGRTHRIEIYDDSVVMLEGRYLFEAYMPKENESEQALIDGFTARLSRYLTGGPWDGLDEKSPIDRVRAAAARVFRSLR